MRLTPEQQRAVAAVQAWRQRPDDPLFWLTGYAGTGKTTVARYAAGDGHVAFLAPTGKAASVLRRRGCADAMTIHKAIYLPKQKSSAKLQELVRALREARTPHVRLQLQQDIAQEQERLKKPHWEYNQDADLRRADLVVVDEASMVSKTVLADLLRTVPKVLCLGDPAQLPPVMATSPLLTRRADFHLEHIHRHAAESGVLLAATHVRQHGTLPAGQLPDVRVLSSHDTDWSHWSAADQVLVYSNQFRQAVNRRFRARLQRTGDLSVEDRVVVLRNSYGEDLYNGSTAQVTKCLPDEMFPGSYYVDLDGEEGPRHEVSVALTEDLSRSDPGTVPITYGYALTVHKAQGSEWDHVLVYVQGKVSPAWLYTALTRASKQLTIVKG